MQFLNLFRGRSVNLLEHTTPPASTAGYETLTETVFTEAIKDRIDKKSGVIRDVKIRGPKSENGREYGPQCDDDGLRLYEGCEVNIEHPPTGKEGSNRTIKEGWGVLRNIRKAPGGGNIGDLHYLTEHADTPLLIERYEKGFPLGLSHNAVGKIGSKNNKGFVEALQTVRGVDLVRRPATTKNLHESRDGETTIANWAESFQTDDAELAALVEGLVADPKASPATMQYSPQDGETDQVKSAIIAAISAIADIDRLKKVLKSLLSDEESDMDPTAKDPAQDKQTTEAIERLTEAVKADAKSAADLKTLTEALAAKVDAAQKAAEKKHGDKPVLESLNGRLAALEAQNTTNQHKLAVRQFIEKKKATVQGLGADRVQLLEECKDEAAMELLFKTWPPAVKGVRAPDAKLQNMTEGAASLKTSGDVRALLRSA